MGVVKGAVDCRCPLPLQADPGCIGRETGRPGHVLDATGQAAGGHKKLHSVEKSVASEAAGWRECLPLSVETGGCRGCAWVEGNVCVRRRDAVIGSVRGEGDG